MNFLPHLKYTNDINASIEYDSLALYSCYTNKEEYVSDLNDFVAFNINALYEKVTLFEIYRKSFQDFYNEYDPSRKRLELVLSNEINEVLIVCSNGAIFGLDKLSSGEINALSILYQIAFYANNNSLVLIDEPEISLHLVWVEKLTKAIFEITKLKGDIQIIISSHSPFISAGYDEFVVEGELLDDEESNND